MASNLVEFGKALIPVAGDFASNLIGQYQTRKTAENQVNNEKWGSRLGQPSDESELLAATNKMNRVAPKQRTEITQQATMTPFQSLMSNAALFGAVPGMAQQIAPGLLPAIGRQGSWGKSIQNLLGPDTSYLDDAQAQAQKQFQEETVPRIMAQYGEGQEQAQSNALRYAAQDMQKNLVNMRAAAHEKGLGRMDVNTKNLLDTGLKSRFENVERPVEETDQFAEQTKNVKSDALKLFGKTGGDKAAKIFDEGTDQQKLTMKDVLQGVADKNPKDPRAQMVRSLKSPQEYEAYHALTGSEDPQVKGLVDHILGKKQTTTSKSDLMNIYKAIKGKNQKAIDKIAVKRGLQKEKFQMDWKLLEGIARPIAAFAAAPLVTAGAAYAAGSGVIPAIKGAAGFAPTAIGLIRSIFGTRNPTASSNEATQKSNELVAGGA